MKNHPKNLSDLKVMATNGDVEALYNLGKMFEPNEMEGLWLKDWDLPMDYRDNPQQPCSSKH